MGEIFIVRQTGAADLISNSFAGNLYRGLGSRFQALIVTGTLTPSGETQNVDKGFTKGWKKSQEALFPKHTYF
jgi:hypothetical protein